MKYVSLKFKEKKYTNIKDIEDILNKNDLQWLLNCEFENANITIKNKTIIWHSGTFYSGIWRYGIWESGTFHGTWKNGLINKDNSEIGNQVTNFVEI